MDIVKVTSKGQLTLPVRLRKQLGIRQGEYLAVHLDGQGIRLQRLEEVTPLSENDPIWKLAGKGDSGLPNVAEEHDAYLAAGEVKGWKK